MTRSRPGTWRSARATRKPPTSSRMLSTSSPPQVRLSDGRWPTGVKGSRYHNMKELRPPSSGATEIRMLFAFDPRREAIFLVAGDKAGNWDAWYRKAIPLADERFTQHLIELEAEEAE